MKMRGIGSKREGKGGGRGGIGRTIVVGVKLDALSRELLTWALVKVAEPGDRIVALHVLNGTDLLAKEEKSSLLSLLNAFDSVLSLYEGFCISKQIDLKLKSCRGLSVRRALVREAKSITASMVIVGIARTHCTIGSTASVAKYCAKKLPHDCSVLAVSDGKVVFQRESIGSISSSVSRVEKDDHIQSIHLFGALTHLRSKQSKIFNRETLEELLKMEEDNGKNEMHKDQHDSAMDGSGIGTDNNSSTSSLAENCSIRAPDLVLQDEASCSEDRQPVGPPCTQLTEEASDDSLGIVLKQTSEAESGWPLLNSSILPESRLGWPLLNRATLPKCRPGWPLLKWVILQQRHGIKRSTDRQISVVQWAMQLPTRHLTAAAHLDEKPTNAEVTTVATCMDSSRAEPNMDGESGAIVPIGNAISHPSDDAELNLPRELEPLYVKFSSTCRLFSYQELQSATSNFSLDNLIGKGGRSLVYRGYLPDGKELAVKVLKSSQDAAKEFCSEIEILTTVRHKNIISLFGFCFQERKLTLAYDLIPKGSLEENLHGKKNHLILNWSQRYKVAIGVAEALDYLHCGIDQPLIHRDVKSSNILLTDDFEPQLSDFGFATWTSMSAPQIICSDVAGTFGYLAPEYFMYGKVNEKIDVYAFGVVLLELLSGRKPISSEYPKGQESLVMWAKPILQSGKVMQLLDSNLCHEYDYDQVVKLVLAASLCIRRAPRSRPRMNLILKLLQGDTETIEWARLQVSASDGLDDEVFPASSIQSHLNLALLDVEDGSLSLSSLEHSIGYLTAHKSLEDYLRGRWSRSSSFD